jgi:hypothetical protein
MQTVGYNMTHLKVVYRVIFLLFYYGILCNSQVKIIDRVCGDTW